MNLQAKLQNLAKKWFGTASRGYLGRKAPTSHQLKKIQPRLETLEARLTPAFFYNASATAIVPITAANVTLSGGSFDSNPVNDKVTFTNQFGVPLSAPTGTVTAATNISFGATMTVNLGGLTSVTSGTALYVTGTVDGSAATTSNGGPAFVGTVAPSITFSNASLPPSATSMVIAGLGFDTNTANDTVSFNNGVTGSVTAATNTSLSVSLTGVSSVGGTDTALLASVTVDGESNGSQVQVATLNTPDWVVTNLANTSATMGSLPWAVAQANNDSGDQITFATSLSGDTITLAGALTLASSVTITGLGAGNLTISGGGTSGVFSVPGGVAATISSLTITDGNSANGGAVNNAGTLTLSSASITDNTGSGNGGGIYNASTGSLTLTGDMITGNSAAADGGGVYNAVGGTLIVNTSTSTFSGNFASSSGGGIANFGTMTSTGNMFSGNSATRSGGGIYNNGTVISSGDTFTNNFAGSTGGGIANQGTLALSNASLSLNTAVHYGGAIATYGSLSLTGSNSVFNNAVETGPSSGGGGGILSGSGTLTLSGSNLFSGNALGGLVVSDTSFAITGGTTNISDGFYAAGTQASAAGISISGGTLEISGAGVMASPAGDSTFSPTITLGTGGALDYASSATVTLSGRVNSSGLGLTVNGSGSLTLAGSGDNSGLTATVYSGTLVLAKSSNGVVHSLGANGVALTINGGTVQVGGTSADSYGDQLYDLDVVQINSGGTLDLDGNNVSFNGLNGTGTITNSGSSTATLTIGQGGGGTGTFSGIIENGNGGSGVVAIDKIGSGTVVLSGPNTYTGSTTIGSGELNAGIAEDAGVSGPFGIGGTIYLTGGALQYSSVNQYDYSGRFSGAGGQSWNIDTNGFNVTFGSLPGGNSSLTKIGAGTLTLDATAAYSGTTTIDTGTLVVTANGAMGPANAAGVTVNIGSALGFAGNVNYTDAEPVTISGSGPAGAGAIENISGTNTFEGPITLLGNATIGANAGTLSLATSTVNLSDGSLTTTGAGNVVISSTVQSVAQTFSSAIQAYSSSLTGYYPLNDASGSSSVADDSSNDYAGTPNGGVTLGATGDPTLGGTAASFNGNGTGSDEIFVNSVSTLLGASRNNWTALAWVKVTSTAQDTSFFGTPSGAGGNDDDLHLIIRSGVLFFGQYSDDTGSGTAVPLNQWNLVTYTFSFGTESIYLNGVLVGQSGGHNDLVSPGVIAIGEACCGGPNPFTMQDAAFFDSALTTEQIAALYAAGEGTGNLIQNGSGTLTLTNSNNSYTGTTTIDAGTLVVTANGAMGPATDPGITVNSGGALAFAGSVNYTNAEPISISGVGPAGHGAIESISGTNSFADTITLAGAATIGTDTGSLTLSGPIHLVTYNLTATGAGQTIINGVISGTASSPSSIGQGLIGTYYNLVDATDQIQPASPSNSAWLGNLTPTATALLVGPIAFPNINAGFIDTQGNDYFPSNTGVVPGDVEARWYGDIMIPGTAGGPAVPIDFATTSDDGSTLYIDGTELVHNDGLHAPATVSGLVYLTPGLHTIDVEYLNNYVGGSEMYADWDPAGGTAFVPIPNSVLFSVQNFNSLTMTGSGTLTLTNTNSYIGATTINSGTLVATANGAMGASDAPGITVASGAALVFSGGVDYTYTEPVSISGSGHSGNGAIDNLSGSSTFDGAITLAASSTVSTAGTLNLGGTIAVGANKLTLVGAGTTNFPGTIDITNGGSVFTSGSGPVNISGTISLSTGNATVDNSSSTPLDITAGVDLNNANLITAGSGNMVISGTISGNSDSGVTVAGAGTLTLSNTNTYLGTTTVDNGSTLVVTANGAMGSASAAGVFIDSGASLVFTGGLDYTDTEAVSISGSGTSGNGAIDNLSGSNTFDGPITLAASSTIVSTAGTLTLGTTGSTIITEGSNTLLTVTGAGNTTIDGNITVGAGGLTLNTSGSTITVAGNINDTGGGTITLTGSGTIAISGNINDTGGGNITLSDSGTIDISGNINLGSTGNLTDSSSGHDTISGVISGTAAVPTTLVQGLTGNYYNLVDATDQIQPASPSNSAWLGNLTPTATALLVGSIDFPNVNAGFIDNVGNNYFPFNTGVVPGDVEARWYGDIMIPGTAGGPAVPIDFATTSDDGSTLYIDGTELVHNDGLHGPATVSGLVYLTPGLHTIDVEYLNNYIGGSEMFADWDPAGGTAFVPIPNSVLFIATPVNSVTENGTGTLTLANTNTYIGVTTVNAGTLIATANGALGAASTAGGAGVVVNSGGRLAFTGGLDYTTQAAVTITGTGLSGKGAIENLSGTNTFSAPITLSGAATIGSDSGSTLNLGGTIAVGANTLTLVGAGTTNVPGIIDISNSGSVFKSGSGPVTISGTISLSTGNATVGNTNSSTPLDITGSVEMNQANLTTTGSGNTVISGQVLGAVQPTYSSVLLANTGLTGYYPLNDAAGSSTVADDNVSSPVAGTMVNGGVTLGVPGGYSSLGTAASFNGNGYIDVDSVADLGLNTNSWTVVAWVDPANGNESFIGTPGGVNNTNQSLQLIVRNDELYFGFFGDDFNSNTPLPLNQWSLVAFTYSPSGTKSIYQDGVLVATGGGAELLATGAISIGQSCCEATNTGDIQQVAFFNNPLSATALEALYTAGVGTNYLTKTGTGTVTLANSNTYTGGTSIDAGTLLVTTNGAMGPSSDAGITVASGAALAFSGGVNYTNTEPLTINGSGPAGHGAVESISGTNTFAGLINLASSATIGADGGSLSLTGTSLNVTSGTLTIVGSGNILIANTIQGSNGVTVDGTGIGTLTLSHANNTYTGATTVNSGGTLVVTANGAMGPANAAGIIITSGGRLVFTGGLDYTTLEPVTITGTGLSGKGAIENLSGTNTFSAPITLSGAATIGSDSSSTLDLGGTIAVGANTLTLVGAGTTNVPGTINISTGGTLTLDGTGTTNVPGTINISTGGSAFQSGSGPVDVSGSISLGGTGNATLGSNSSTPLDVTGTVYTNQANLTTTGSGNIDISGKVLGGGFSSLVLANPNLTGYYPLNDAYGSSTVADDSSNDYAGTIVGSGVALGATGDPLLGAGTAASITGPNSSYIALNSVSNLLGTSRDSWTAMAWVYVTSTSQDTSIFGTPASGGGTDDSLHLVIRGGVLFFGQYSDDTGSGTQVPTGQWDFVTYTFSSAGTPGTGTESIYLNGVLVGQGTGKSDLIAPGALAIGEACCGGSNPFTIQQAALFDSALSSTQIANLYAAGTGAVAFSNSLTKTGSGTVILSGQNNYLGSTTVNSGTLEVNGSIQPSSSVTVNSPGILTGTGTVAPLTTTPGGNVAPGDPTGTLSGSTANFSDGGILTAIVPSTSNHSLLALSGSLTLGGSSSLTVNLAGLTTVGTVTIVTDDGQTGQFSGTPTIVNNPYDYPVSVGYTTDSVFLKIDPVVTVSSANLLSGASNVTINGYGFDPNTANDSVTFDNGGVTGTVSNATSTSLTVSVTGLTGVTGGTALDASVTVDGTSSGSPVQVATVTTPTSTTLVDEGPDPSLSGATVSFVVSVSSVPPISGETVSIVDTNNGNTVVATPTLTNGTATFTLSSLSAGTTHDLKAFYTTDGTNASSYSSVVTQTVQSTFGVNSVTATPDGVVLTFNDPIDANTTVLYSSPGISTAADVTVVNEGTSQVVRGSLVIDPTDPYVATFVQTNGLLAAGTYQVTVTGGATGVEGLVQGEPDAVLTTTVSTVTVAAVNTPVLSVPSFARGPGQPVQLTDSLGNDTGIPISINNAMGATQASFTLTYDPTLLTIAPSSGMGLDQVGALSLSSLATAAGIDTINYSIATVDAHHDVLTVTLTSSQTGGVGLTTTSALPLVTITASVPDTAPYLNKALLNLTNVEVNSASATGVSGVDENAYLGNVTGSGGISALDSSLADQVGAGAGTGFGAFKDLDPNIIGAVGDSSVSALDASLIDQAGAGETVAQIPIVTFEGPLTTGGPDPYLYLSAVQGSAGQTVTETLYLDVTNPQGIQLSALDEAIGFDPSVLQISDVRSAAGLAGLGSYGIASTADNASGVLLVGQAFGGSGLPPVVPYGTDVAVLQFNVTLNADEAVGTETGLTLLQDGTVNGQTKYTAISDNEGALTWTPGMAPSNSGNAAIDGSVTVVAPIAPVPVVAVPVPEHPVVVLPKVFEPVRRVTPDGLKPASLPAVSGTSVSLVTPLVNVEAPVAETMMVASVSVATASLPASAQPETGVVNALPGMPGISVEALPASVAANSTRPSDSGASLSLVALGTNKSVPTASTTTTSTRTTSVLDEMYRLFGTLPSTSQGNAYNFGVGGEGATEAALFDVWDLEDLLVDLD